MKQFLFGGCGCGCYNQNMIKSVTALSPFDFFHKPADGEYDNTHGTNDAFTGTTYLNLKITVTWAQGRQDIILATFDPLTAAFTCNQPVHTVASNHTIVSTCASSLIPANYSSIAGSLIVDLAAHTDDGFATSVVEEVSNPWTFAQAAAAAQALLGKVDMFDPVRLYTIGGNAYQFGYAQDVVIPGSSGVVVFMTVMDPGIRSDLGSPFQGHPDPGNGTFRGQSSFTALVSDANPHSGYFTLYDGSGSPLPNRGGCHVGWAQLTQSAVFLLNPFSEQAFIEDLPPGPYVTRSRGEYVYPPVGGGTTFTHISGSTQIPAPQEFYTNIIMPAVSIPAATPSAANPNLGAGDANYGAGNL